MATKDMELPTPPHFVVQTFRGTEHENPPAQWLAMCAHEGYEMVAMSTAWDARENRLLITFVLENRRISMKVSGE